MADRYLKDSMVGMKMDSMMVRDGRNLVGENKYEPRHQLTTTRDQSGPHKK
ncbi:hypothetical protein N9Z08_00835 [Pirellulales bacterium]|jgi:hypothetical protein|nr:hypothetical protein [Pirellulales bacterium]